MKKIELVPLLLGWFEKILIFLELSRPKWLIDYRKREEKHRREEWAKNFLMRVLFGLTLAFREPLNNARQWNIPEDQKQKIMEILRGETEKNPKYILINFCNRYYHLGDERQAAMSDILATYAKSDPEMQKLQSDNMSVLEMYKIVRQFVEKIPLEVLQTLLTIVQLGAGEYFKAEKDKYAKEEYKDSHGYKVWKLSEEISIDNDSALIATGMFISTALSDICGKSGLRFGIF